jgi:CBS-domain-containing membrane protein
LTSRPQPDRLGGALRPAAARHCSCVELNDKLSRSNSGWRVYKFLEETAGNFMTRDVATVTRDMTMRDLYALVEKDDFNTYPVVEDSRIVGIVTKFDFLKCFALQPGSMIPNYEELMKRTVGELMTPKFIAVDESSKLVRVLQLMVEHRMRSVIVATADHLLQGIISREDVMRALQACAIDDGRSAS